MARAYWREMNEDVKKELENKKFLEQLSKMYEHTEKCIYCQGVADTINILQKGIISHMEKTKNGNK